MQYRALLLCSLLGFTALNASAQQQSKPIVMQAPARTIKTDSIVTPKSAKGLLASNMPAQSAPAVPFRGVPLAGQKSYYGNMTEYVNGFVRQYLGAHQGTLATVQGRGNNKFSLIDNVLVKHNIPKELKYLAVIESALNHNALSGVGAAGPWQLMESTARMMGLTVNGKRDDRTDWFKSTNAAARYLGMLYTQMNDWLLVVAAYNSGPVPVQRAIERTGSHNFWDIKKYLPRETQGHVLAFIATASIFEKMSKFIGGDLPVDFKFGNEEIVPAATAATVVIKPQFTDEELKSMAIVRISEPVSLELMADELGMDKKLLRKWNPDYDLFVYKTYTEEYYKLRIPKDKLDNFIEKKDVLVRRSKEAFSQESL